MLELRYLSGPDVDQIGLTNAQIMNAVTDALRSQGEGTAALEPRTHLHPPGRNGHFNVLRGHLEVPEPVSGVKVVGDFVDNYKSGLPSEMAMVLLFDPDTGAPRAVVDATVLTEARTGALTAIGAQHLARPDSKILGHIGARGTAWWNVVLLDELFDFDEIRVTSRRRESYEPFAQQLSETLGKQVTPVATAEEALAGADIMVEASRLTEPQPLLRTEWVTPGTFVVPYGTVSALELDLLDAIDKVVVDDWGQANAGPYGALRPHLDAGLLTREGVHAELGDIVAGNAAGRETADERILFWHRGLSTTDVAIGRLLLAEAEQRDIGTVLPYR